MNNRSILGTEPIGKLIFKLAIPSIVAQIINILYNIVDRIYIGHIEGVGATALTGVGVTMPLIMLISAFTLLAAMGAAPRAAIKMGEGDYNFAEKILGNSFSILVLISIVLTTSLLIFSEPILMAFGASENTIVYSMHYMNIYLIGTISVQLSMGMNAFITVQGFSVKSMLTVLIGAILNIILDPIFIFVLDMGVKGAALATIISQTVSAIWVMRFLLSKKTSIRLKLKNMRLRKDVFLPCIVLGLAPFIMAFTESAVSVSFNTSLQAYGSDIAVGAMTILMAMMQFSMLPLQGLMQGCQSIISYNYGAKNYARVKSVIRKLLVVAFCFTTLVWIFFMFTPGIFIGMFTEDAALYSYTEWATRLYMPVCLLFSFQMVCQQCFVAVGNAKISIFLASLRKLVLLIPLIHILPNFFENKVMAVFLAEPISDFLAVATTTILFVLYFKKLFREREALEDANIR